MKVELGTFARWGIETRLGSNLRGGLLMALLHYTRRLKSGWEPVLPPVFAFSRDPDDLCLQLELQVNPETEAALKRSAKINNVDLNQIFTHAVFVYLADLDMSASDRAPIRLRNRASNCRG